MLRWLSSLFRSDGSSRVETDPYKDVSLSAERTAMKREPNGAAPSVKKRLPKGPDGCYTDPARCYRCGKPSVDGCCETVHLYDNVRVGAKYPDVIFDQKTLHLPLCRECNGVEVEQGWGFFIYLQEKGYNGWRQGAGPSKAEINAVWQMHLHPPRDVWAEALAQQKKEQEQRRIVESHALDEPIAIIDQYEVLKELGTGGFGSVFLARDTVSKTLVAIKGLPEEINRHEEEKEELRKNFSLIAKLHHPNIASPLVLHPASRVHYLDRAVEKALHIHMGDCFMVMEFARGETLMKWKSKYHVSRLSDYAKVIRKIAEALDFAHEQGILHRDIKPSNVMVRYTEGSNVEVKVLDFGLAAELKLSMNRLECRPQEISGTMPYMAPEQWRGEKQGVGTDLYALAVVAYELLQGTVPFASAFQTGNTQVMYAAVTNSEVDYPRGIWPEMKEVLQRGLAKKSRNRFFSCVEFARSFAEAIALYERRRKDYFAGRRTDEDKDWHREGNIKAHPLNVEIGDLVLKQNQCGYSVIGFGFNENFFWEQLEKIMLGISPERLLHSNEVLSINFSQDMDTEERLVFDVSNACREKFGERDFGNIWKGMILWSKLLAEVVLRFGPTDPGVRECILYRKMKYDEAENKKKNENFQLKNGMCFVGNPFYREKLTSETVLLHYYASKLHLKSE